MNNLNLRQRLQQINHAKVIFCALVGCIFYSIAYNYYQYRDYYNTTVKLFETNSGLLSVTGLVLLLAGICLKLLTFVFFGELTLSEVYNCYETMWDVAIELFMMLALYPNIISFKYFFTIIFATMSRYLHSIMSQRVFLIERMPFISVFKTTRLLLFMVILFYWDIKNLSHFLSGTFDRTLADYLFFEQYSVMLATIIQAFCQHMVLFYNNTKTEPMILKTTYITIIDTFFYVVRMFTYLVTCSLFFTESTIPMFICVPLIKTINKIGRNITKLMKTRQLFKFIDKACIYLTPDELAAANDRICIICRDHMEEARRLPCKHIFHSRCLLLWFQNGNACPICRSDIFKEYDKQQTPAQPPANNNPANMPNLQNINNINIPNMQNLNNVNIPNMQNLNHRNINGASAATDSITSQNHPNLPQVDESMPEYLPENFGDNAGYNVTANVDSNAAGNNGQFVVGGNVILNENKIGNVFEQLAVINQNANPHIMNNFGQINNLATNPYYQLLQMEVPINLVNTEIPVFQYMPRNLQILIDSAMQHQNPIQFSQIANSLQIITDPSSFAILKDNKVAIENIRDYLNLLLDQMK